ncbi:S-adenosyl-L-methionine-dependent methyltransferase [Bisporella sp. PMI_857]|nr:S-adenosyl-L-methionine-dependent methyltransferase [Bisporella sp. PMI_857]
MVSNEPSNPNHLEPSKLGTKEYWDNLYTTEITNHSLDPSDEGTIWFDDSSAEDKAYGFLEQKIAEENILPGITKENCSFLDLGTGNGHFLFRLRAGDEDEEDGGWGGRMLGVDYSLKSVEFAKRIAEDKGLGGGQEGQVEFQHWDIIASPPSSLLSGAQENGWDVILDKGTFDAISLSEEKDGQERRICEGYKEKMLPLLKEGGLFLVTSCNWTEAELDGWFKGEGLERVDRIQYRSFQFGGQKGQTISSVCFRKCGR